jgi:DNA-binding PadR family transcriptional regulator
VRKEDDGGRALGEFEQLILFALLRLGDEAYGAAIRQEILARAGRDVSPGAVFTGLERLEARGYVSSWFGEATAARGGKRKRHYRIEAPGVRALARTHDALQRMSRGLAPKLRTP